MTISGTYVKTFAEASHALPQGMHMNADYPFMMPPIVRFESGAVVLRGGGKEQSFKIVRANGQEHCVIVQRSSFEVMFNRPGQKFTALPFKDDRTPAALGADGNGEGGDAGG